MDIDVNTGVSLLTLWGMRVFMAVLILIAGWVIGNWLSKSIQGLKSLDATLQSFLGGLVKYTVFAVAVITVLGQFGVQTASLIAVLGAAGLAVGLALQGTLSNVAAGVMLLILRPFGIDDYIVCGPVGGTVKSLGLFGTELDTADNVYVYVPNSALWGSDIRNYSRNRHRRQDLTVGISYADDIDKAFKSVQKVLKAEKRLLDTKEKEPQVMVGNLADSSVDLTIRFWCKASDYWDLKWDLTKAIKEQLDKDGISIPFPTVTQYNINPVEQDNKASGKKVA